MSITFSASVALPMALYKYVYDYDYDSIWSLDKVIFAVVEI